MTREKTGSTNDGSSFANNGGSVRAGGAGGFRGAPLPRLLVRSAGAISIPSGGKHCVYRPGVYIRPQMLHTYTLHQCCCTAVRYRCHRLLSFLYCFIVYLCVYIP